MKSKETYYADILLALVERGDTPKQALQQLRTLMQQRGHEGLLRRVRADLRRRMMRFASNEAVLTIAREGDRKQAEQAVRSHVNGPARTEIDASIIGGWTLQTRTTFIDASYKKHLLDVYRRATR